MDDLINKHLSHFNTPPHDASVKYFLQTGKINGNFRQALKALCNEAALRGMVAASEELPDHPPTHLTDNAHICDGEPLKLMPVEMSDKEKQHFDEFSKNSAYDALRNAYKQRVIP